MAATTSRISHAPVMTSYADSRLRERDLTGLIGPGSACARLAATGRPHFFQIVEAADLGAKHVDDDVAGIDQNPVGVGHALDTGLDAGTAKILDHPIGDRSDMAIRTATRNDHVVADARFAVKVD